MGAYDTRSISRWSTPSRASPGFGRKRAGSTIGAANGSVLVVRQDVGNSGITFAIFERFLDSAVDEDAYR